MVYRFGTFVLDPGSETLRTAAGVRIPLRAKSFTLLQLMVENTGQLLTRKSIMDSLWPNVFVTDDSVTQCVGDIRVALGREWSHLLRTIRRRGYIFDAGAVLGEADAVEAHESEVTFGQMRPSLNGKACRALISVGAAIINTAPHGSESRTGGFDRTDGRPSVAVLPFYAATPGEAYVATGLSEDLITALAHLRSIAVIPGASDRPWQAIEIPRHTAKLGRALRADYALEGGVRLARARVRVTARLVSSATEAVVWADRFEGDASETFALQNHIARVVTGAVESLVIGTEIERAARKGGCSAYDLYLRALPGYRTQTAESTAQSIAFLRRAVTLDPGCAPALATLAHCLQQQITQGWRDDHPDAVAEAMSLSLRAMTADQSDPVVLAVAGFVSAWLGGDHELGAELAAKATAIGDHSALVLAMTGAVSTINGDSNEAIDRLEAGRRVDQLSPFAPRFYTNLAGAHLFAGRFDEAARLAQRAVSATPDYTVSRLFLIVALSLGGYGEMVERAVAQMQARKLAELPHWPGRLRLRHAWMPELLDEGLRRAGLLSR
jgi:TolB-like protein/DNA-binding winged helix-turn-helix (wHTH) protein